MKRRAMTVRLPEAQHEALRRLAFEERLSMQALIEAAVNRLLAARKAR